MGNQMEGGGLRAVVGHFEPQQDVLRVGLGVFDLDVEESILVEHAGVDQFVFTIFDVPGGVRVGVARGPPIPPEAASIAAIAASI